jgi:agmatinase
VQSPELRFSCSSTQYKEADVVIVGMPMDITTVYRPGTRFGPSKIREVSYALETYSFWLKKDLADTKIYDFGDNYSPFKPIYDVSKELDESYRRIRSVVGDGKKVVVLGGSHLITYPVVKAIADFHEISVIHFDAHADLRDKYNGEKFSHATVMKRVAEIIDPENLYQFGIRSGIAEELEYTRNIYPNLNGLEKAVENIEGKVYVTVDIDVFDPAFAPGTGTPEPGGVTPAEFFEVLNVLAKLEVVGFDVVEVSPPYDYADITSILAARIVRDFILAFFA